MGYEAVILKGDQGTYSYHPDNSNSILGRGGSGIVFRGVQFKTKDGEKTRKVVAIKQLYLDITHDRSALERVKKVASIKIEHEGLLKMLDVAEEDDTIYVISEYLDGKAFDALIDENKEGNRYFDVDTVYNFSKSIVEALGALHANNPSIIHRDMKPGNIMLCENGVIKLLDYGIAKISDGSESVTIEGSMMGTPAYLPLEQIRGLTNQISPATDFYSVGILLYQLFTNELPFDGSNYEVIRAHEEDLISPNKLIPPSFFEVIQRVTDKNPLNRYNKADKFLKALDKAYENRNQKAVTSKPNKGDKFRKKSLLAIIPLLILLGIFLVKPKVFSPITNLFHGNSSKTETEKVDIDKDGFDTEEDECPDEYGSVNGCPDSDGDGIIDKLDECPDIKGDTENGCLEEVIKIIDTTTIAIETNTPIDSDGDGFEDKKDNCPNMIGTLLGCPDSDRDGIADHLDKCPNEKGKGKNGCPIVDAPPTVDPTIVKQFDANDKFGRLVMDARNYRSVNRYQLAISSYLEALTIKGDASVQAEKDKLEEFCMDNYNKHYNEAERKTTSGIYYDKALDLIDEANRYAITQSKMDQLNKLKEETIRKYCSQLIERGDTHMEIKKYNKAIDFFTLANKYCPTQEISNKIALCKEQINQPN